MQNWNVSGALDKKESFIDGQRRKERSGIRHLGISIEHVGDPRNVSKKTSGLYCGLYHD